MMTHVDNLPFLFLQLIIELEAHPTSKSLALHLGLCIRFIFILHKKALYTEVQLQGSTDRPPTPKD